MAKVLLEPIGSSIDTTNANYVDNLKKINILEQQLDTRREKIKEGWGKKYQEKVYKKNKLLVWDRIKQLADINTKIFTIQSFVNYKIKFYNNTKELSSPAAGVITALIRVNNIFVVIIANDNTVSSGAWWPQTTKKIIKAQEIALKLKLPVIYLVDCSGLFLPEQSLSFPGHYGAGRIFKMNSLLSNAGIAQIAGVMGDCIAGGGYMPIISDRVFMTEQAYMVIAGTAIIKGAKNQKLTSIDIGGANVHVHLSNCADFRAPNDEICIQQIRKEITKLPSSAAKYYQYNEPIKPEHNEPIGGLLPINSSYTYNIKQILARIIDESLFWEIMPNTGQEIIVGIGRINGLYMGIAANIQELTINPNNPKQKRPGAILYKEGVKKLSIFSRACNDDGIPLIWLQDVAGFDIGKEAEENGLLGYGSSLIYTNSTNTTPMITVLLRKASGAGYYAMAGLPYDPILQLSTTISNLAVMDGKTLAIGTFKSKLDHNFQIKSSNINEIKKIKEDMIEIEKRIKTDMDPYKAASQMDIDEIIKLEELRDYLCCISEICYQNHGYRRIKNPRIWSMHDLV